MFTKFFASTIHCLKVLPKPRDKIGTIARTFADNKDRYGNINCTIKSCQKQNVLKIDDKTSTCKPKEPGEIRPFSVCKPGNDDPCNEQPGCCGMDRLKGDPCYKRRSPGHKKLKITNVIPRKSVWEYTADCCGNPCPEMEPRFDTLYYRMKDKMNAKYQQTWVECPYEKIPKRKPCYDIEKLPPLYRSKKKQVYRSACEYDALKLKELCCLGSNKKCRRISLPGCRKSRIPPKCRPPRGAKICKKRCCPYPAFSECCRKCVPHARRDECHCLRVRMKCEAYAHLRRKLMYDLPPNLPEWPPRLRGPRF